uniref:phage tail fiber protein n=1 Tax=Paractinoplanes polyasparticus TaxID=2856853 RepID=UPI003F69439F
MTVGQSTTHAHAIINVLRGTTYTAPANVYVKLHTGDPGSAGTANASATTTRMQMTLGAPSAGSATSSAMSWTSWVPASETLTHFSIWDNSTAGNFLQSGAFSASKSPTSGDTVNATVTVTQGPIAA